MNYRHAFHAGNFADVTKHLALVALLARLKQKEKPFRVIDTHAGRGLYDLASDEARRTGEAEHGIGKLRALDTAQLPDVLKTYLDLVRGAGEGRYPGSPLIAARLLRPSDKLVAIEKHPEEFAALSAALASFPNARVAEADGYARLPALLPPPERRGLVLIDPPFEADDEFAKLGVALASSFRRFATGIYLVWFPVKSKSEADRFCGEILTAGATKLLRIDTEIEAKADDRLTRAGLAIVNPLYGFADDLRAALDIVSPALGSRNEFTVLAGE